MIDYLCLAYYYIAEYFETANCDAIQISNNGSTAKCVDRWSWRKHMNQVAYCHEWIKSNTKIVGFWSLEIVRFTNKYVMEFGVATMETATGSIRYKFRSDTGPMHKQMKQGDIVSIKLELAHPAQGTLTYLINNCVIATKEGIQTSPDIKYKMAVGLSGTGDCVTFKGYEEYYNIQKVTAPSVDFDNIAL